MFNESVETIKTLAAKLKGAENEIETKVDALLNENRESAKKINALEAEITKLKSADMFSKPETIGSVEIFTARIDGATPDALRSMGDALQAPHHHAVAIIASSNGAKATILAVCGKNAIAAGVKAGDVVREVAKLAGGSGGGRPDSAMAGAKDVSKLDEAIAQSAQIVKNILG